MRLRLLSGLSAALLALSAMAALAQPPPRAPAAATAPPVYNDTPEKFVPPGALYDFERRDLMIPMRDGVKLHTVVLVPKGAGRAPILLTRTPYGATEMTSQHASTHLASVLDGYDNATDVIVDGGYIRVVQDVRGKYGSEGDYVMNRPLVGQLNPTKVDHATDTYDTIDWLVKNIPETNGKVGILGISYDGFTALMALVNPHPALKASVPMNPMVDGWMGDDWFHKGASRVNYAVDYVYEQEATRTVEEKWPTGHYDLFDFFLKAGSVADVGKLYGADQLGMWKQLMAHPDYDGFWQGQALDRILAGQPLKVPVLLVHSLWDEEDIYGAPAVFRALKPKDARGDMVYLAMGPWHHGGAIEDGSHLGKVKFDADTARWFRQKVLAPFLAHYLKDEAPPLTIAPVTAFETGANEWRKLDRWPLSQGGARLYLHDGFRADMTPPAATEAAADDYVADPAKPTPYRNVVIRPTYATDSTWGQWLVDDQRFASRRTDVLTYETDILTAPVRMAGAPVANIVESTSGSDGDVVVKLIDVYPDEVHDNPYLGGYQLAVSMDVIRGRYREGFETGKPIPADTPLPFRFTLPDVHHVFLPGHRIMVQIQSSWFPLYDRNPQTFVPNIFFAGPQDYRKATIRVFHTPQAASYVDLPVVK